MRLVIVLAVCLFSTMARAEPTLAERDLGDLLEALAHPDPAVRMDIADELGRRGEARALVPLLKLLSDESSGVRAHTAEALRVLGDERAVPFVSRLLDDPSDTVRCRAVLALGDLGGKYVLPSLDRMLADPAVVVRAAAVRALGEIGDPLSLEKVAVAASSGEGDPDGVVASASLIAATKIGGAAGFGKVFDLVEGRLDKSWFLRASVAHAAGLVGVADRAALLAGWLANDEDHRVCEAAAGALGLMGETGLLVSALDSEEAFRRRAAISGLDRIEGGEVEAHFVDAARDEDPDVVLEAASVLLRRGRRDAFPLVIGMLDREMPVWLAALGVLELRTGLRFGRNVARWTGWFEEVGERLVLDPETGVYEVVN